MNKFAEQLKNYLEEKKISYKKAGVLCDLDRSLLRRYADGSRSPRNMEAVEKIADGLSFREEEKKELKESFIRSKTGERQYQMNRILDDLICRGLCCPCQEKEEPRTEFGKCLGEESVINLYGEQEVKDAVYWIFENTQKIRMVINPEYPDLAQFLLKNLQKKSYCLEHIIEVDSFYGEDDVKDIWSFYEIFPLLFFSREYRVYHHYSWRSASKESPALNFFLTEKGVLLSDRKMLHGIFSNRPMDMEYYQSIFEYMKKSCGLYARNYGNPCRYEETDAGRIEVRIVKEENEQAVFRYGGQERKVVMEEEGMVQMIKKYLAEKR